MLDILRGYQGIIGAIIGVVATLFTTEMIKRLGKIHCYFYNWESRLEAINDLGAMKGVIDIEEAEYYSCFFEGDFFNSSEIPKSWRKISIVFENENGTKTYKLQDSETRRKYGGGYTYDAVDFLNFPPKQMIKFKFQCSLGKQNLEDIRDLTKVYLQAESYKGKKIKKLVNKFDRS